MDLRPLTRDEIRGIDTFAVEELGMPSIVLMENAGRGSADLLEAIEVPERPVIIVGGKGNNGGDGFVVARHLEYRGYDVEVLLLADADDLSGDAKTNWNILVRSGVAITVLGSKPDLDRLDSHLAGAGWIVDALLGTGVRGALREPYPAIIERFNRQAAPVLAIDVPSGLDCDTGQPLGAAVEAAHTATFVARKVGFDAPGAARYTGQVHVVDLGIPRAGLSAYVKRTNR